ncbi:hypothetical protein KFK09_004709 [Dendrobium nobile]|uniref:Uncharacterized protein n=1 Tax=Dendrobium nobile TaxID=94219 RepID=A0A8T3BWB1_DENNO|nr:hypothetical protein KFK09_004709 [Dendrobium nobile]
MAYNMKMKSLLENMHLFARFKIISLSFYNELVNLEVLLCLLNSLPSLFAQTACESGVSKWLESNYWAS